MQKTLTIQNQEIVYKFNPNRQSRSIKISIKQGGEVLVSAPRRTSQKQIEIFLRKNENWILKNLSKMESIPPGIMSRGGKKEYQELKEKARQFIEEELKFFSRFYSVKPGRITIRNQSSRWGSCSADGNLSFNYRIVLLPRKLASYIVAHEVCHLLEFNHSPKFWKLVEKIVPDYREIRRELRKI